MSNNYDAHPGAEVLPSRAHDMSDDHEAISATLEAPFPVQNPLLPSPSSPLNASHVSSPLEPDILEAASASVDCATAPDPSNILADALKEGEIHNQVAPPKSIVRPSPHDQGFLQSTPLIQKVATASEVEPQSPLQSQEPRISTHDLLPDLHRNLDGPAQSIESTNGDKMIFGHHSTAQAAQTAQRRRNYATTNALTDYEADMTSKDRAKQKEAVKRYLTERVKQDWTWEWPRPEPTPSEEVSGEAEEKTSAEALEKPSSDVDLVYTGEELWQERDEWISNASEDEEPGGIPTSVSSPDTPSTRHSPYRFESPDGVGDTIKRTQWERKQRRKKRLAEEMTWNSGLRCFVSRRDAWTGARKVSRRTFGVTPAKVAQPSSLSSEDGGSSTAIEKEEIDEWEDDIEIPVAPPILPPENQMRASILPGAYNTIYDKVVIQSLQPSCPMNLKDITRSCVQGWKRDGEWPPKSSVPEPKKKGRKMSVASLFGLDKHEKEEPVKDILDKERERDEKRPSTSSGIRKSIQKILSLGHNANKEKDQAPSGNGKLLKGGVGSSKPVA